MLITPSLPGFPLSALRLHGEVKQIEVTGLRFSLIETQEFFADSDVKVNAEMIEQFTGRTEGWALAMQMVRMLLGEKGHGDNLLDMFGGTNADMSRYSVGTGPVEPAHRHSEISASDRGSAGSLG